MKRVDVITGSSITKISPDGYMRLTFEEFQQISLVHLISGVDEDNSTLLQKGETIAEITGYTEWVSTACPAISVGWDWIIQPLQVKGSYYKRASEPRSNLMLIDAQKCDFGMARSTALIGAVVDEIFWQIVVQAHIDARYA